jgi:hypothetical protein
MQKKRSQFFQKMISKWIFLFLKGTVAAVVSFYLYIEYRRFKDRHPLVKRADAGFPILGNLFDFTADSMLDSVRSYPVRYGGNIIEYYMMHLRGLLISDVELVKEILMKRPKRFVRLR